jgi:hypothetical protein
LPVLSNQDISCLNMAVNVSIRNLPVSLSPARFNVTV